MSRSSQRILAAIIGIVFVAAGILKALNPGDFAIAIVNYHIVSWSMAALLAVYLPWLEILCGAALVLRVGYRGGLCVTAGLCAVFVVVYASTRIRGLDVECGCFGHGVHRGFWPVLIMDAALCFALVYLLKADLRPLSPVVRGSGAPEA
jgi:uncharacterized membrane protein